MSTTLICVGLCGGGRPRLRLWTVSALTSRENYMKFVVDKVLGETPLQALERLRAQKNLPREIPMTYAGRLDPMAEGRLLILTGEDCKRRSKFDHLDKEYVFEILFGVESDTGDVLGIPKIFPKSGEVSIPKLKDVARSIIGRISLPYPAYSSKTVLGKPLFMHAHSQNLSNIEIPISDSVVYEIKCLGLQKISTRDLFSAVSDKVGKLQAPYSPDKVGSDFRKSEILKCWENLCRKGIIGDLSVARFRAVVSSGTYIRSLAPMLADKVGNHGLAFSIKRTIIGRYLKIGRFGLWVKML